MRMGLRTHPKVVRMASALNADRYRVIGALHAVWTLADEHTKDGRLPGYSLPALDDSIGWAGFSAAMRDIEWLVEKPEGLVLPRFDEHNGASAKRRATEAERKRRGRKTSADDADKKRTRERGRERSKDKPIPPNGGSSIWDFGKSLLIEQGLSAQSAGALIGSWLGDWAEPVVADAIRSAAGKADIRSYVAAILKTKPKKGARIETGVAMP